MVKEIVNIQTTNIKKIQSLISKDIYWIYQNLYANICFNFTKICHISIWETQLDYHHFPGQTAQKLLQATVHLPQIQHAN